METLTHGRGVREQFLSDILSTHSPAQSLLSHTVRGDSELTPLLPCDTRGGRVNVYPTKSASEPDRGLGFSWIRVTVKASHDF